jgi:hypothetical protein
MEVTRNIFTFRAPRFVAEEDSGIDGPFKVAYELSDYLTVRLKEMGFEVGPPVEVFKGCTIFRTVKDEGGQAGFEAGYDKRVGDLHVMIVSTLGVFARLVGKTDAEVIGKMCSVMEAILKSSEGISDVKWLTEDEWLEEGGYK